MLVAALASVGVVDTGVGVGVESFAELFDLLEYDMSGIAAGARTFKKDKLSNGVTLWMQWNNMWRELTPIML